MLFAGKFDQQALSRELLRHWPDEDGTELSHPWRTSGVQGRRAVSIPDVHSETVPAKDH
jgi:hypothetical protein